VWSPIREEAAGGAAKHQCRIATGAFTLPRHAPKYLIKFF